jgi:serine/threonine protein kinase/Flp pilus assembly protein TadD
MSQPSDANEPVFTASVHGQPPLPPVETHGKDSSSLQAEDAAPCPSWEKATEAHAVVPPPPCEVPSLDCPSQLGPYPIKGQIGAGGIGVVLQGYDAEFNRSLAVKLLQYKHKSNPDLATRFLDEAQLMGQLQHPNIPPVHRLGTTTDGRPYFSMKLIKGKTLAQMLNKRSGPSQDLPRYIGIFENVCKALAYTHSREVIHRDLKPENIMVGSLDEMYVMDWGMARKVEHGAGGDAVLDKDHSTIVTSRSKSQEQLTRAGMGTIGFMPPEQILAGVGQIDARSDVFGLGAILCVILTGKPPYQVEHKNELFELAMSGQLCLTGLARLEQCSADTELIELARKCLAHRREDRPAHAGEVVDAVTRYQAKVQEERRRLELKIAQEQIKKLERRKRRRLAGALLLLILTVLGIGYYLHIHIGLLADTREELAENKEKLADIGKTRVEDHVFRGEDYAVKGYFNPARAELSLAERLAEQSNSSDLKELLHQAKSNLLFLIEYDKLQSWTAAAMIVPERMGGLGIADGALGDMLRKFHFWNEGEATSRIAERIKTSSIQVPLLAAFDYWAMQTQDEAKQRWLQDILRQCDPHFTLRTSVEHQEYWKDEKKMAALASAKQTIPAPLLLNEAIRRLQNGDDALIGLRGIFASDPENYWGQLWLGMAYLKARNSTDAARHFLEATRLRRDSSVAFNNLGCAYFCQGQFDEAQLNFDRAWGLQDTEQHPLYKTAKYHLDLTRIYPLRETKLKLFQGKMAMLPTAEEQLQLADLCFLCKQMFRTASELTKSALEAKPQLTQDGQFVFHRFQGARAALLAANGMGDAKGIKPQDVEEFRKLALKWLQEDLKLAQAELTVAKASAVSPRAGSLFWSVLLWPKERDFSHVRENNYLDGLPIMEQKAWAKLWADVQSLLNDARKLKKVSS